MVVSADGAAGAGGKGALATSDDAAVAALGVEVFATGALVAGLGVALGAIALVDEAT
jgi:hypothetical protein